MIQKEDLLRLLKKEFATTVRVMLAHPQDKRDFKPHERSQDAIRLMSTFVFEMYLLGAYMFGEPLDPLRFQEYAPESIDQVIRDFEKESFNIEGKLVDLPEEELRRPVSFGGTDFVVDEFALMMLHDQIHHRGQLSVYVRMAGGKVPAIYGPSADDPATNL